MNFKKYYSEKYDELAVYFEQSDTRLLIDPSLEAIDVDPVIKTIIQLIHNNYNIDIELLISDYMAELDRLQRENITFIEIPMYKLNFALEEGSYIILFRLIYPKIIENVFDQLLKLDELIFNTGRADNDDYAYYLLELSQIIDAVVEPLSKLWMNDHQKGKINIFSERITSAVYSYPYDRGNSLINGAKRVLRAKYSKMGVIEDLDYSAPWTTKAKQTYMTISDSYKKDTLDVQLLYFHIAMALFHRKLLMKQQQDKIDEQEELKQNGDLSKIAMQLKWNELDPSDINSVADFRGRVINQLFGRPEENPYNAALNLFRDIIMGINIKETKHQVFISSFQGELDNAISGMRDSYERDRVIVETVQKLLPSTLMKIKADPTSIKRSVINIEEIHKWDLWDSFEANFNRIKRINDETLSLPIIKKVISFSYRELLQKQFTTGQAVNFILDKLKERFEGYDASVSNLKIEMEKMLADAKNNGYSAQKLDAEVVDKLSNDMHQLFV